MYDVLVEIGGGGRRKGSDWLKVGNKHEKGELTCLASDPIRWDRSGTFELGFCVDVNDDSGC